MDDLSFWLTLCVTFIPLLIFLLYWYRSNNGPPARKPPTKNALTHIHQQLHERDLSILKKRNEASASTSTSPQRPSVSTQSTNSHISKEHVCISESTLSPREKELIEKERDLLKKERDLQTLRSEIELELGHLISERNQLDHDRSQQKERAEVEVEKRMLDAVRHISEKPYLNGTPVFDDFHTVYDESVLDNPKLLASFRESMKLHYPLSAKVNLTSSSGNTYTVSLTSCTCPDFQNRHQPCKHMYRLACELGLLINYSDRKTSKINAATERTRLEQDRLDQKKAAFDQYKRDIEKGVPHLISLWTDFEEYLDSQRIRKLEANRAKKSADTVRQIKQEKKALLAENKTLWHQLRFLEAQFPWIEDYKEHVFDDPALWAALQDEDTFDSEYDTLSLWLSPEEFASSLDAQRYQLALDRYKNRKRSDWSAGIDYERYIGYLYENNGYRVSYIGATEKKEDMGRDLIVRQGNKVKIIQCKRLSKAKNHIVRENVVFQLYGSAVLYGLQNPKSQVSAAIYTTSFLSKEARECAQQMGIEIHEDFPLDDYPLIKCNIGADGVKRFHLPFSQRYDRLHITPSKGDCYVQTVQDAMDKGFVKAKNWIGK